MDRVATYRDIVKRVLKELREYVPEEEGVRYEMICDDENQHYQLLRIGWQNKRRVHGTLLHIDIRDDKVWVEHDGTNLELVQELLDAGIPADHIVLGFHPPAQRKFTEFAVA
jgi:hypothetical protein